MLQKFIGDRAFYRRALAIALPIILQNGITNVVALLDNIMVGSVGTLEMSGVSVVNQLLMVFTLCIFGASSGVGIFTAQFHGSNQQDGIRHTIRIKVLFCTLIAVLGIGIFLIAGTPLISAYLQGEGNPQDAAATLDFGLTYLQAMLFGLPALALSNVYASTLRECGKPVVPMVAGIVAVFFNLFFNYVLIFGNFGAPKLGVTGAAVATVISRYVELLIVAMWSHTNTDRHPYFRGVYRGLYVPKKLLKNVTIKAIPLLLNEFMWSAGVASLSQCYSTCALEVVPALNISNTLSNLSSVVFLAMGSTVGIIMGQMLGAGESETVIRDHNRKLITLGVASGALFGCIMASVSGLFPLLYNTQPSVRALATNLIIITAAFIPIHAYLNPVYFTLRSGGKTFITFLFDSGFMWVVALPVAFVLSRFTDLPILPLYLICQALDLMKCVVGYFMIKSGTWMQNLTQK